MPGFKPKFAVPSSQTQQPLASLSCNKQPKEQLQSVKVETKGNKSDNTHGVFKETNLEETLCIAEKENTLNCAETLSKDSEGSIQHSHISQKGLTDSQYEDIFDSVMVMAATGTLPGPRQTPHLPNPNTAAEEFTSRTCNISPVNIQVQNEVTPNTSPLDETSSPSKLLLQRPVKKVSESKKSGSNILHKRKTLEYIPSNATKASMAEKIYKKSKKGKEQRRKSDSDIITHRKKVLNKGVWVQCGERSCLKWRFLHSVSDPTVLPDYWRCSMNKEDEAQSSCEAPEVDWTSCLSNSQDHFVYSDYNAGSIVWARMAGYPSWPAMVDSDPDTNLFYEYDASGKVSHYHVVFLDDNVSRAWISSRSIEPYTKMLPAQLDKKAEFSAELNSAITSAEEAVKLPLEERLAKFSFEERYLASTRHKWAPERCFKKQPRNLTKRTSTIRSNPEDTTKCPPSQQDKKSPDNSQDYWEEAKDKGVPSVKKAAQGNTPKATGRSETKVKRKPTVGSQLSRVVAKAKAPVVPSFKAPSVKPAPPKVDGSPAAVVPTTPPAEDAPKSSPELTGKKMTEFDPDVYTMEMEGIQEENKAAVRPDVTDKQEAEEMQDEEGEPLDLSLKYNTAEEDNRASPELNNKVFGEDFWEDADEQKNHDVVGDPFDNLAMDEDHEMLGQWGEEKLKELDELMPVIAEHLI